jgi:hypothetical protein
MWQAAKAIKLMRQFADPCQAAAQASYECLERTHYNRQEVGPGFGD